MLCKCFINSDFTDIVRDVRTLSLSLSLSLCKNRAKVVLLLYLLTDYVKKGSSIIKNL
jgi:hypothetical protein